MEKIATGMLAKGSMKMKYDRRQFLFAGGAAALASGCVSAARDRESPARGPRPSTFHVFSKMFQPPVTPSPEALCELMKGAGYDGIQWTVRKKGHVAPENAKTELPRLCKIARSFGLGCDTICTDVKPGDETAETVLKTAADCGIALQRPAYFFYDAKTETFAQSLDRIRRGFGWLADLAEKTGVKATYQNHSSWGPSVFGGLVWDVYECVKDLDPKYVGLEYDPMHAFFETNLSWSHGFELVAPWIAAIDLKDFHYQPDPKNPKKMKKAMVAAGEGVVPWNEVKALQERNGVRVPYVVHFEYAFDRTDLPKSVKTELDAFRRLLA